MLAKVNSFGLRGIDAYPVDVETDIHAGLPGTEIVGLPDASTKEAKERVKSALKNSGFLFPPKNITVNLAPADTKKEGSLYDLPIALGILAATGQLPAGSGSSFPPRTPARRRTYTARKFTRSPPWPRRSPFCPAARRRLCRTAGSKPRPTLTRRI